MFFLVLSLALGRKSIRSFKNVQEDSCGEIIKQRLGKETSGCLGNQDLGVIAGVVLDLAEINHHNGLAFDTILRAPNYIMKLQINTSR
jgi:hypothetical protein